MGISRLVNTDFWIDETVIDQYTPEDKYFWLYLLTNPQTKQLGVYKLPRKLMAFQMGYSLDTVNVLIDRFQNKYGVIIYSDETQEIAILNYLKYSIIKGGKPVLDCIEKDIGQVKDKTLLGFVYGKVSCFEDARETMAAIKEKLSVYDIYNDNDNDSNVPRNVPRIVTESSKSHKKESNKMDEFVSLIDESSLSEQVKESMKEWLAYKLERKEPYKPIGFKNLIAEVYNRTKKHGDSTVIEVMKRSMSNNWKGIIWDTIDKKQFKGDGGMPQW